MIETCKRCGNDFLTEADYYIVLPKPSGVELNCFCYINELEQKIAKKEAELNKAIEVIKSVKNCAVDVHGIAVSFLNKIE